ncbi:carbohydrate ABC transporter permease [Oceaniglobus trochenteri]|uniref:carbohydrate ABC transporter permease n=1 Tax=Oceaniglobus trochenteri TaxID=2763260 RepID=UPI001CFFC1AA|nr:sugar ABC transporter permease [Oceaniglobus trochenteri]
MTDRTDPSAMPATPAPRVFDEDPVRPTLGQRISSKKVAPWLFMAPVIAFGLIFFILPIFYAAFISLTRWNSLTPPKFVGLANYKYLLTIDPRFWDTFWNTAYFAAGSLAIGIPIAMILAYAFTRAWGQAFWRSIYWLPMITNVVAVAYIWKFLLDDSFGLINQALGFLGLPGPGWLTNPDIAMLSTILVFVWMQLGHNMLLFSAGLASIDDSYYEAARLDGANETQVFLRITVPLLKPTILFVLITNFITGLSYFTLMLVLTQGGPLGKTTVTALYMYDMAFADLRMGRASAAAYILFFFILIVTIIQLRIFRRGGVDAH